MPEPAGRYAQATEGLLRTTALDVVGELLLGADWDDLSMSAIAGAVGVSRQTIYNEFGSRDGLAEPFVLRESGRFLDEIEAAVAANAGSVRAAVVAALEQFLAGVHGHPVIRAIATGQGSAGLLGSLLSGPGSPVLPIAVERLVGIVASTWPTLDPDDVAALAQVVVRLGISHATQPAGDPAAAAAEVDRVLGPFLDRLG